MRRIHSKTHHAARQHLERQPGGEKMKLRAATATEQAAAVAAQLDPEKVVDAVVAHDDQGNQHLLAVIDDRKSRHLNAESALATAIGLIPVVGPPIAATFALKDIVKAGVPLVKAKVERAPSDPADRALLRMGLKHLGLSAVSIATHGAAHYAAMGVEALVATKDLGESKPWRQLARSLWNALQGLFSVRDHHNYGEQALRVVTVLQLPPARSVTGQKGEGNPEQTAGPPKSG